MRYLYIFVEKPEVRPLGRPRGRWEGYQNGCWKHGVGRFVSDSSLSGQGTMVVFCEQGGESSGSIKSGGFLY